MYIGQNFDMFVKTRIVYIIWTKNGTVTHSVLQWKKGTDVHPYIYSYLPPPTHTHVKLHSRSY